MQLWFTEYYKINSFKYKEVNTVENKESAKPYATAKLKSKFPINDYLHKDPALKWQNKKNVGRVSPNLSGYQNDCSDDTIYWD